MNENELYTAIEMLGACMELEELEKLLYSMYMTEVGDRNVIDKLLDFYGLDISKFNQKYFSGRPRDITKKATPRKTK